MQCGCVGPCRCGCRVRRFSLDFLKPLLNLASYFLFIRYYSIVIFNLTIYISAHYMCEASCFL
jgi:hypothetical protein